MPKRQSIYQTHGVGYGSYNPNYVQRQDWNHQQSHLNHQGGYYNQGYTQSGYSQPMYPQQTYVQPVNSTMGYYQPTGIGSGLNINNRIRNRSNSSSSRSSDQSPSRLDAWRRNHELKKQDRMRAMMPMQTQYPMRGQSNVQQVHSEGFHDNIQNAMGRWQWDRQLICPTLLLPYSLAYKFLYFRKT